MRRRLSVIVPALNEAPRIQTHASRLARLPGVDQVIVADGGSTDGTADLARTAGEDVAGTRLAVGLRTWF